MSEDELCSVIGEYDGLIIRSATQVTPRVVEEAHKLRVVGRAGIGVDNVDIPAASRRGIVVMNTPTGNSVTTAEHALALLASLARKIPQAVASMRSGKWEKSKFQGREIAYKTLGIIGLGNIGRIVADRAQGLKMKVIGVDPVMSSDRAAELGIELVELDELLTRADFITIHAPLTPDTKNMINDAAFDKMKSERPARQRGPWRHRRRRGPRARDHRREDRRRRARRVQQRADRPRPPAPRTRQRVVHAAPRGFDLGGAGARRGRDRRAGGRLPAARHREERGQRAGAPAGDRGAAHSLPRRRQRRSAA